MNALQHGQTRFASLGSGSRGNATLICVNGDGILIDCGFSAKEAIARMQRLGFSVDNLLAVLLTHEHGDHAKGVSVLSTKYRIPVYTSAGTRLAAGLQTLSHVKPISADTQFQLGPFMIEAVTVPHDAREPLQFIVHCGPLKIGVLTDLGSIPASVISSYHQCDALLVEANHDLDMLARGPYPKRLQRRVSGAWGHLNNLQTLAFLRAIDLSQIQHLVVGHISEKNNSVERVEHALGEVISGIPSVSYAKQDVGFDWLTLLVR